VSTATSFEENSPVTNAEPMPTNVIRLDETAAWATRSSDTYDETVAEAADAIVALYAVASETIRAHADPRRLHSLARNAEDIAYALGNATIALIEDAPASGSPEIGDRLRSALPDATRRELEATRVDF
jgi:hypothetical protein